jgi:hypothetical protein
MKNFSPDSEKGPRKRLFFKTMMSHQKNHSHSLSEQGITPIPPWRGSSEFPWKETKKPNGYFGSTYACVGIVTLSCEGGRIGPPGSF